MTVDEKSDANRLPCGVLDEVFAMNSAEIMQSGGKEVEGIDKSNAINNIANKSINTPPICQSLHINRVKDHISTGYHR